MSLQNSLRNINSVDCILEAVREAEEAVKTDKEFKYLPSYDALANAATKNNSGINTFLDSVGDSSADTSSHKKAKNGTSLRRLSTFMKMNMGSGEHLRSERGISRQHDYIAGKDQSRNLRDMQKKMSPPKQKSFPGSLRSPVQKVHASFELTAVDQMAKMKFVGRLENGIGSSVNAHGHHEDGGRKLRESDQRQDNHRASANVPIQKLKFVQEDRNEQDIHFVRSTRNSTSAVPFVKIRVNHQYDSRSGREVAGRPLSGFAYSRARESRNKKRLSNSNSKEDSTDRSGKNVPVLSTGSSASELRWRDSILRIMQDAVEQKRSLYGHTIKDTRDLFQSMDLNDDGFLSLEELSAGLRRLGLGMRLKDIRDLIKHMSIEESEDDNVSYDQFVQAIHSQQISPRVSSRSTRLHHKSTVSRVVARGGLKKREKEMKKYMASKLRNADMGTNQMGHPGKKTEENRKSTLGRKTGNGLATTWQKNEEIVNELNERSGGSLHDRFHMVAAVVAGSETLNENSASLSDEQLDEETIQKELQALDDKLKNIRENSCSPETKQSRLARQLRYTQGDETHDGHEMDGGDDDDSEEEVNFDDLTEQQQTLWMKTLNSRQHELFIKTMQAASEFPDPSLAVPSNQNERTNEERKDLENMSSLLAGRDLDARGKLNAMVKNRRHTIQLGSTRAHRKIAPLPPSVLDLGPISSDWDKDQVLLTEDALKDSVVVPKKTAKVSDDENEHVISSPPQLPPELEFEAQSSEAKSTFKSDLLPAPPPESDDEKIPLPPILEYSSDDEEQSDESRDSPVPPPGSPPPIPSSNVVQDEEDDDMPPPPTMPPPLLLDGTGESAPPKMRTSDDDVGNDQHMFPPLPPMLPPSPDSESEEAILPPDLPFESPPPVPLVPPELNDKDVSPPLQSDIGADRNANYFKRMKEDKEKDAADRVEEREKMLSSMSPEEKVNFLEEEAALHKQKVKQDKMLATQMKAYGSSGKKKKTIGGGRGANARKKQKNVAYI